MFLIFYFLIYLIVKSIIRGIDGKNSKKKISFKENIFTQC
jgi:hypothetical protein